MTEKAVVSSLSHMWFPEEVKYLETLSNACKELANRYKEMYCKFKGQQTKYKMPAIVLGSVLGLASFGSNQFGEKNSRNISLFVGVTSLFISIISSVEAFLKLGENMSGSLVASMAFQKLKERIDVELALPEDNRSSNGLVFLRECYQEYQKIFDLAPAVLTRNRYITSTQVEPYIRSEKKSGSVYTPISTENGRYSIMTNNRSVDRKRSYEDEMFVSRKKTILELPE